MTAAHPTVSTQSLRDHVLSNIEGVLWRESFPKCDNAPIGILTIVDAVAAYHEEGKELYPRVLITTDLDGLLKSVPFAHKIEIRRANITSREFPDALKLCAPLATDGWVIFMEIDTHTDQIRSGLVSLELSETSPTFYRQVFGDLSYDTGIPTIYIANIGKRVVAIDGRSGGRLVVSLTLRDHATQAVNHVQELARVISFSCEDDHRDTVENFVTKLLETGLRDCHGALIAVVKDDITAIEILKNSLTDGTYLEDPIDTPGHLKNCEAERTPEAFTRARLFADIVKNMLSFDGITVFTNTARVLAYHCFVKDSGPGSGSTGARSRAYEAMIGSNIFTCCFCRSQDGDERIWESK
ncbi:MAG: hypothetical protein V1792_09745 [Pseudomonadota bacterium]